MSVGVSGVNLATLHGYIHRNFHYLPKGPFLLLNKEQFKVLVSDEDRTEFGGAWVKWEVEKMKKDDLAAKTKAAAQLLREIPEHLRSNPECQSLQNYVDAAKLFGIPDCDLQIALQKKKMDAVVDRFW